ncbi:hypothetical protein OS493_004037 [Desmophyllum pertusum]|uniref:Uncharacterized protein n=1 Tax=Desmophyllum pertusum TaxID=174260 RepID=A0A9X0D646_9CNID|nr:hypothetical protein OS493_004037 [Desmophyllum pertusum]
MSHEDDEDSIRESVVPYFSRGLLMLEDFVEELDKTPHDISVTAAQRIMPYLLGRVDKAYKAFQNAESTIDEINTKMDNDLQDIVVQEKTTNDQLRQTQEDLTKLEEKEKVLQGECSELEQQLSKEEINLRKDSESLNERKTKLEEKKKKEKVVNIVTWAAVPVFGLVGVAVKGLIDDVLEKEVANAEEAVKEATTHLERTKERFGRKKRELSNLTNAKEETKKKHTTKSQELKMLQQRKAEIKNPRSD